MKSFVALLKREYFQYRGPLLFTPLLIAGILFTLAMLSLWTPYRLVEALIDAGPGENFAQFPDILAGQDAAARRDTMERLLFGVSIPFHIGWFIALLVYLSNSLYRDRRDRSLLFWKSLPISDTRTVAAKVVSAGLVAPAIMWSAIVLVHLLLLMSLAVMAWRSGIPIWDTVLLPGNPFPVWLKLGLGYLLQIGWYLPLFGSLLLASAHARKSPQLYVFGPILVLALLEGMLSRSIEFLRLLQVRAWGGPVPMVLKIPNGMVGFPIDLDQTNLDYHVIHWQELQAFLLQPAYWLGLVPGLLMIVATVRACRYHEDL